MGDSAPVRRMYRADVSRDFLARIKTVAARKTPQAKASTIITATLEPNNKKKSN